VEDLIVFVLGTYKNLNAFSLTRMAMKSFFQQL